MKKTAKKSTSIEFTKEQYESLVRALEAAGSVYALLGDAVNERYRKRGDAIDDLASWVLAKAGEVGMGELVEIVEHRNVLRESDAEKISDDLDAYDEQSFWDLLAHKLADRELERRYGADLREMDPDLRHDLHIEFEERFAEGLRKHGLGHIAKDQ
ncbi:MAG TPA: hypothetical protein VNG29_01725 [Candidatus Paceibacterota bacterium]|nr:hypothetical protein [Candidatus Paceibacterota bacterium]